jgi:N-acyl homoserine lactone hydrolase
VIPGLPLGAHLPGAPPGALISPPCYCYLLTNGATAVLVDTGANAASAAAAGLEIEGDTAALLDAGLRACDVAPEDVSLVVHTHLHYDHVGNDLRFPSAEIVIQQAEVRWATGPDAGPFYLEVSDQLKALGERVRTVEGEAALLPGLRAIWNGGHTPGHQSVVVTGATGDTCICGDIVPLRANAHIVGESCPRTEEAEAFLELARTKGWDMIPSHDPVLRTHAAYVGPGRNGIGHPGATGRRVTGAG